jgi:hypothetical protein
MNEAAQESAATLLKQDSLHKLLAGCVAIDKPRTRLLQKAELNRKESRIWCFRVTCAHDDQEYLEVHSS